MPLGSPLPPPRLSWPGPGRLPRTIMPSTAAGGGLGAAAGAAARGERADPGTQAALRGAGRGCGVRPPGGLAGTMNRARRTHSPRRAAPRGRQESPFCRAAAAAALLGMARPGRRRARAGGGAGSCPSFLPSFLSLKSKPRPRGGARAAARAGPAVGLRGSAAHVGFGGRDPARRHFPATAAAPAHLPPATLGRRPGRGRGRCWRAAAASLARSRSARPPRPAALPASRLTERGPAPGRHALRPRAPRGPPPAVGASPCPAPAQLRRDAGPRASVAPRACPRRPGRLRRSPRRGGRPPGRRLLPCPSASDFRASRRHWEEGRGPRGRGRRRLLPRARRPSPGPRAAVLVPAASPRSPPPPPPPPRSPRKPFVWRHRLSFKSRFLLACPRPLAAPGCWREALLLPREAGVRRRPPRTPGPGRGSRASPWSPGGRTGRRRGYRGEAAPGRGEGAQPPGGLT